MLKVRGVKAIKIWEQIKNIPLDDYIDNISKDILRWYFTKIGISIFGIQEDVKDIIADENKNLYEIEAVFEFENKEYTWKFIVQFEWKIREAYANSITIYEFKKINYIKPYNKQLWEETLSAVLKQLEKEVWTIKDILEEKKEKSKKEKDKEIISFKDQKDAQLFKEQVEEIIQEARELIKICSKDQSVYIGGLKRVLDNLIKYRNSSNVKKVMRYYEVVLLEMEKVRNAYLDQQKQKEINQEREKIITNIDIIKEYKLYEKVNRIKTMEKLGSDTNFSFKEVIFYKIFGRYWIHIKLLFEEIYSKLKDKFKVIYDVLNDVELLILLVIVEYLVVLIYRKMWTTAENVINNLAPIYYILIQLWLFWVSISIWKWLWKYNYQKWILSIFLILITYFVLRYFFISKLNFLFKG